VYDFLLLINSNLGPISHRYWNTASYLALSFGVTFYEFMGKLYGSWN